MPIEQTVMKEPIYSNIEYDDAFRTMEGKCDDVLLPFVNYFFGENYDHTAVITRMRNEHIIEHEDHSKDKRISDSHFAITQNDICKKYHLECESKPYDGSLLVRLFEYGTQVAIEDAEFTEDVLHIRMPHTGLLLLRASKKAPRKAKILIETPEGSASYSIPIIKEADFTIDLIFEKKLYLLIPFYIFNFEKDLDHINRDESRIERMLELYKSINDRLQKELADGNLSSRSYSVIIGVTTHGVFSKLTANYSDLNAKVGDYMGGKVLDLPETIFFNRGVEQGTARIVENMLKLGKSCSDIMESTGCSEEMIRQIEEQMKTKTV